MRKIILGAVLALAAMLLTPASAPAIINGSDAITNPGAVSLWTDNPHRNRCTGTLVDDDLSDAPQNYGTRWVLTAAHCVYAFTATGAGRTIARIGSTDNTVGYTEHEVEPGQFWYNPAFDPNTLGYDVMVVKLKLETPDDPEDFPVMKWRKASLPVGANTQALGWGWVCDGPPGLACSTWYQGPLQKASMKRVPDTNCAAPFVASQVCFAPTAGGPVMACSGDSGGPMYTKEYGANYVRWSIVGDGDGNYNSCLYGPNGTPGLGLAIDIGRPDIQTWMDTTMTGGTTMNTFTTLPPATPRILQMIN